MPFYHCFGMVMGNLGAVTNGATMVIPAPGFDPAATLHAVATERCTSLYGVPTMFIAELNDPDFRTYDLTVLAHRDHGRLTVPGRGDETGCWPDGDDRGDHLLWHDRDFTGVHTDPRRRLAGPPGVDGRSGAPARRGQDRQPATGETLPRGEPGELCTRGYSVMLGYWNEPQKTAEAIDADGWMHTGDLGIMDDKGYLNITGRIKDMVIRGGENVVSAGDRGVPPHPPRRAGRAGCRRPGRPVRGRIVRLDHDCGRAPSH